MLAASRQTTTTALEDIKQIWETCEGGAGERMTPELREGKVRRRVHKGLGRRCEAITYLAYPWDCCAICRSRERHTTRTLPRGEQA